MNGKYVEAQKQRHLLTLPNILVVQLKRFWFDWRENKAGKYDEIVTYPEILEINPEFMTESQRKEARKEPQKYQLIGVVVHKGKTLGKGHYIAYTLQQGTWFECDDKVVKKVQDKTALEQQAYMLWYRKFT